MKIAGHEFHLYWLTSRALKMRDGKRTWHLDIPYIAAQLSLDLCGWRPKGQRIVKLWPGRYIGWYTPQRPKEGK